MSNHAWCERFAWPCFVWHSRSYLYAADFGPYRDFMLSRVQTLSSL